MTLRIALASLVALGVFATPAVAVLPAGQTSASADDQKIVCKGETRPNSRFKDKVCKTRAEWEQIREQQQRDAREWIDRPQINDDRGG